MITICNYCIKTRKCVKLSPAGPSAKSSLNYLRVRWNTCYLSIGNRFHVKLHILSPYSNRIFETITQQQKAIRYKSLPVWYLWLRLLWHNHFFIETSVSGRKLETTVSSSVSLAIQFLSSDFTCFIHSSFSRKCTLTHVCACKCRVHF